MLEYARGGRLWDHLSCYQRSKESYDYATGDPTERNAQNSIDKLTHVETEKKTAAESNAAIVNRLSPQLATKPLAGEDTPLDNRTSNLSENSGQRCDSQVSKDSEKISCATLENTDQLATNNMDGITVPCNGNNNKAVTGTTEVREVNSESVDKCSEKTAEVSRDNKHSLFVKLDEYFASSVQRVPNEHAKIWAAELVLAVAYLHTAGIICRYYFFYMIVFIFKFGEHSLSSAMCQIIADTYCHAPYRGHPNFYLQVSQSGYANLINGHVSLQSPTGK